MGNWANLSSAVLTASEGQGAIERIDFFKNGRVASAAATALTAQRYNSFWEYEGHPMGAGAQPTTVAVPTNASPGSMGQVDPSGGRQKFLTHATVWGSASGTFTLYDRLLHIGGFNGTTFNSAQNVGGTLTRYTGAASVGNEIWMEIYATIGSTARNATVIYTDEAGNAQTTPTFSVGGTGYREAQHYIPISLAAGSTGVRGVTSVTIATGSTGTAGNFGINIMRPLVSIPVGKAGICGYHNFLDAPIEILAGACLFWVRHPNASTVPVIGGSLYFMEV